MPRFVVLWHAMPPQSARPSHWDLLLQSGEVLRSWAIESRPDDPVETPALALPDHRLAYLDYEGPVSGDRGEVTRWDGGEYRIVEESGSHLNVTLQGTRLLGRVRLRRTSEFATDWSYCYTPSGP